MSRRRVRTWAAMMTALGALLYISLNCCCCGHTPIPPPPPLATSREEATALRKKLTAAKARPGPFTVEIGDAEFSSYLDYLMRLGAGEFPARDVYVRFARDSGSPTGYIEVWATFVDVAPTDIPTYARATVEAENGHLAFHLIQADAGPCAIPGMMRESIAQVLSESLAELELGIEVKSVEVTPGKMVVTGRITGQVPDLP